MTKRLLIINPNTSRSVSETLHRIALHEAAKRSDAQLEVRMQTARLGASYISDEISFAIAGHALLDAYAFDLAQHPGARPDAVLIGCFGDPGLLALQQLCPAPVLGLAQASLQVAYQRGPYAVITGGQAWLPMLSRLIAQLSLQDRLLALEAVDKTGAQLAANQEAAVRELADLCLRIVQRAPALQNIVLGGAALGGLAPAIQEALIQHGLAHVQLLDSVSTSVQAAMDEATGVSQLAGGFLYTNKNMKPESKLQALGMSTLNLSSELQKLLS
jgi:allantoin racemase